MTVRERRRGGKVRGGRGNRGLGGEVREKDEDEGWEDERRKRVGWFWGRGRRFGGEKR